VRRLLQQAILQNTELLERRFVDQRRSDARTHTGPGWQRPGQALFTYADGRPIRPDPGIGRSTSAPTPHR
jgi:hypothetical protein